MKQRLLYSNRMAKTNSRKILYRVNYRTAGRSVPGYWTESKEAMLAHKVALSLAHGPDNVSVEMVDKRTGRPFFEDREERDMRPEDDGGAEYN